MRMEMNINRRKESQMIVEHLDALPKEDQLSDIVFNVLSSNPILLTTFVSEFTREHKEDTYKVFSRKTLASILPSIPPEIGRKRPDIVLLGARHLILIENKTGASLTEKQLSNYSVALSFDNSRSGSLVVIAPQTTRYRSHGHNVEMISWDQIYAFVEKHLELVKTDAREIMIAVLARMRYEYYQTLYDDVISQLTKLVTYSVSYHGQNPKDIYYSKHIVLPAYPDITFSLGIYVKAPSYLLVNPFKIVVRGRKYDMNQGDPIVRLFKERMLQLPATRHALLSNMPGYVVDLWPGDDNSTQKMSYEIMKILGERAPAIQEIVATL